MPELFALLPGADDIEQWARFTRSAEDQLAELIQMLIGHTSAPTLLDIPVGKAINQAGADGLVECTEGNAWVPAGASVWEWGVPDPDDKANKDYTDRTRTTDEETRRSSTFVFVTPWKWGRSRDWTSAKKELGEWHDVRVLDSSDLAGWLRTDFASHLWLAERIQGPFAGEVRTLSSVWKEWSDAFWPPTSASPELLLAGRSDQAATLRSWIGAPGYHFFRSETEWEGAAFVAAALMSSEQHAPAVTQAAVVESTSTWLRLVSLERQPMILIRCSLAPRSSQRSSTDIRSFSPSRSIAPASSNSRCRAPRRRTSSRPCSPWAWTQHAPGGSPRRPVAR